jgi:hypothetical protein
MWCRARSNIRPVANPFGASALRSASWMMFNLNDYARMLMADYLAADGKIEIVELRSPEELCALRQKTVIRATGFGARALLAMSPSFRFAGSWRSTLQRSKPRDTARWLVW